MNKGILAFLIWGVVLLLLIGCAKKGRPTGGPKDEAAPVLVSAKPPHYTVNFDAKEIKIYFDEFIKLENVMEQLIISPPLKFQPEIKPLGTASKFISIKLLDTLKPNTTYSLNFGESVVDNNEKNVLHNFKYVFSTGPVIDSLKIKGTVSDAFEKETEAYTTIMLYEVNEAYNDSLVYTQKPLYVGSTLDTTIWEITNIKAGTYALIALKDRVKNYLFEPQQDKIGYYKEFITIPGDTVFDLKLFKEETAFEVVRPFEVFKGKAQIGYRGSPSNLEIEVLNASPTFDGVYDFEQGKDSLNYWHKGIKDSIVFAFKNNQRIDTVNLSLRTKLVDSLKIRNASGSVLHPQDTLVLRATVPIVEFDRNKIKLIDKDSIAVAYAINLAKRRIEVNFERKEDEAYTFTALPGAFTDFFGAKNDSLQFNFSTKKKTDYGQLSVSFTGRDSIPLVIQILTSEGDLVRSKAIPSPKVIHFLDLEPDNYIVRVIYDENGNQHWDSGSFLLRKTPEKVAYFQVKTPIKANWEVKQPIQLE